MSGYQEVITDPSYAGQVIAFTSTHIGNYGTNAADDEAPRPALPGDRGVRPGRRAVELALHRGPRALPAPPRHSGADRRRHPAPGPPRPPGRCGARAPSARRPRPSCAPPRPPPLGTDGLDLVSGVTTSDASVHPGTGDGAAGGLRIVAYDFGVKTTMVRLLTTLGTVTVVPAGTAADDVLALEPDGVFLSNGPGDPAALPGPTAAVADLVGRVPVFGICLGHQILATALGGSTYKLPFGHHGANHPVQRLETGVVEITSQNHNYAVAAGSIPDAETTHVNLNDGVIEGFRSLTAPGLLGAVPPRGGARAPRRPLPLRRLPRAHAGPPHPFDRRRRRGALMPRRDDLQSILVIGSGPIVIGQACEFDYSGTQACRVLREEGYRVILANSNPATIMTDPATADRTYVEPLDPEVLTAIIEKERPDALLPTLGRADGAQPDHGAGRARRPRALRGGGDRGAARGHLDRRGPGPLQGGHGGDRPRGAPLGLRPLARRRRRRSRPTSASRSWCGRASSSGGRGRASPRTRRTSASWPPRAWRPARSARSWSSSRSPAGRSSSSRSCATPRTTASSSAPSRTSTPWACTRATPSPWRRRRP